MGLVIGIFIITAGWALIFGVCMGGIAWNLKRIWPKWYQHPTLKNVLAVLLWALTAGSAVIVIFLCLGSLELLSGGNGYIWIKRTV